VLLGSYGRETWPVNSKKQNGINMLENNILRRVSGTKREEIIQRWEIISA
jgi:hypothetical protein